MRGWLARRRERREREQAERDAALAHLWQWALQFRDTYPASATVTCLGQVYAIRQNASTGTKAYVAWRYARDVPTAAWFDQERVGPGEIVVATGHLGYGEHHGETVFYVDRGHLWRVPADAPAAHERQQARAARAAGNS